MGVRSLSVRSIGWKLPSSSRVYVPELRTGVAAALPASFVQGMRPSASNDRRLSDGLASCERRPVVEGRREAVSSVPVAVQVRVSEAPPSLPMTLGRLSCGSVRWKRTDRSPRLPPDLLAERRNHVTCSIASWGSGQRQIKRSGAPARVLRRAMVDGRQNFGQDQDAHRRRWPGETLQGHEQPCASAKAAALPDLRLEKEARPLASRSRRNAGGRKKALSPISSPASPSSAASSPSALLFNCRRVHISVRVTIAVNARSGE